VEGGYLSNLYNYEIINKTSLDFPSVEFKLVGAPGGRIKMVGDASMAVPKQGMLKGVMFIEMPENQLESRKTKLEIEVWSNGRLLDEAKTNFLGPVK
jgi:hypothetical protein